MKDFKERWEITQNWQLLYPLIGLLGLGYSSFKLSFVLLNDSPLYLKLLVSGILFGLGLKLTLWLFKILAKKWILEYRWEMIRVFMIFAITGSSSVFIGRPFIFFLGITKENLNPVIYWVLFIIIGLIFYQFLLVFYGWLFGQFEFFWNFEKKMLRRFGLKRFVD